MTVLVLLLLLAQASAGSPETGLVTLAGDDALVTAMQRSLAERGIAVGPPDAPDAVHLQVQPDPTGLRIFIRDRNGNVVERVAATPEVGAVVVESWMREDLANPLLQPHAVVTPVAWPAPPRTPPPPGPISRATSVMVASQISLGTDSSLWMGASVGACVRVGWFCLGVQTHFVGDTALAGEVGARYAPEGGVACQDTDPTLPRQLTRMGAGALATLDLPLRIGAGTFGPGLGVGLGWQSTRATLGDHTGSATSLGLRTATHLFFSWPLLGALSLDAGLWVDVLPLAHTGDLGSSGFVLPGEPLGFMRIELGLRYGGMGAGP